MSEQAAVPRSTAAVGEGVLPPAGEIKVTNYASYNDLINTFPIA